MSKPIRASFFIVMATMFGVILAWGALHTAAPASANVGMPQAPLPTTLPLHPAINSPEISSITSPSPSCVLPRRGTDICYISWNYMYAFADPNYMITMTVQIDDRSRARYQAFFQTSMYVPAEMLQFSVSCGAPGASGDPNWGLSHSYALRARDSAGLKAANYGQVFCPADQVPLTSASLSGPISGKPWVNYTFNAAAIPVTTTLPVTYTWEATGHAILVDVGGASKSRSFSWSSYGSKVTISNPVSSLIRQRTIVIQPYSIFLPLLRK
jgi:hypothetical protein